MAKLTSLTVTGYKSIRELRNFKLNNLNVLIGANGAGKSNFISLFRLLNQMYEQNLQVYVPKQGGPDAFLYFGQKITEIIHAVFSFEDNAYEFILSPTTDNRLIFDSECGQAKALECGLLDHLTDYPHALEQELGSVLEHMVLGRGHAESQLNVRRDRISIYISKSVKNWKVYHFNDTSETAKVKKPHPVNQNLALAADAANLAAFLRMLKENYEPEYIRIIDTIRLVAPFFGDFVHRSGNPEYVELEWTQKGRSDTPFKAHLLSDGTLRFICLTTLLLQPIELLPDTILIDEPELGLHPYAISVLADIFKQVAEERQLIVSTQSVELVNELSPEDVIVVDYEDDASVFRRFSQDELSSWLEEYSLGELWKRNILGGRP